MSAICVAPLIEDLKWFGGAERPFSENESLTAQREISEGKYYSEHRQ
jgi:hypothetical protein